MSPLNLVITFSEMLANDEKNDEISSEEAWMTATQQQDQQEEEKEQQEELQTFVNQEHYKVLKSYHEYYQRSILLNNTAVYHFESGNYEKARTSFRDALKALRNSTVAAESCSRFCEQQGQSKRSRIRFKWSKYAPLHSEMLTNLPSTSTPDNIFRRALFLIDVNNTTGNLSSANYLHHHNNVAADESKAIIYNLALSYLYSALKNKSTGLLKKARQLFEKIILFIPSSPSSSDTSINNGCSRKENCSSVKNSESMPADLSRSSSEEDQLEAGDACNKDMDLLNKEFNKFQLTKASYNNVFYRMEHLVRAEGLKRHDLILMLS